MDHGDTDDASANDVNAKHKGCHAPYKDRGESSYPCRIFQNLRHERGPSEERSSMCVYCQEEIAPDHHTIKHSDGCRNSTHEACIADWLHEVETCPACAARLSRTESWARDIIDAANAQPSAGHDDSLYRMVKDHRDCMTKIFKEIEAARVQLDLNVTDLQDRRRKNREKQDTIQKAYHTIATARGFPLTDIEAAALHRQDHKHDTAVAKLDQTVDRHKAALEKLKSLENKCSDIGTTLRTPDELRAWNQQQSERQAELTRNPPPSSWEARILAGVDDPLVNPSG